jgi:ATP-dependent DNA helicase RecQ
LAVLFEQLGAELSVIKAEGLRCEWNETLHFCRTEFLSNQVGYEPTSDDDLLYDVLLKGLLRGKRPFASYFTERWIVARYGGSVGLREAELAGKGSISYSHNGTLPDEYAAFSDVVASWSGVASELDFDQEHPENEREFFKRLIQRFGTRIAHFVTPQAEIASILPFQEARAFQAQRLDFLLSFPNGKCLIIEPGDHDAPDQIALDSRRDNAFRKQGIETLRPRNVDIRSSELYEEIEQHLARLDTLRYLKDEPEQDTVYQRAVEHLFLLPSLIVRVERMLGYFLLRQGLVHKSELHVGVIERDLECAEISMASFLDRISRMATLYGIELGLPRIHLHVQRESDVGHESALGGLEMPVEIHQTPLDGVSLDLLLDIGIKSNALTIPLKDGAPHVGSVRQTFPHNHPVRFGYRAQTRPISVDDLTDAVLETFVQDFFRKNALRPGQGPILRNVLSQKTTIGLLPTSAGKSLCYQLAALLTPGVTIIVDPIVALMQDQVQSLVEHYGISRVLAWHAGAGLHDQNVGALLGENVMVFIAPERLQRPTFRTAMHALNAADVFVNYAVIDEAHCVSMWGHDFRPSYLTLERNFREYCKFQGRMPVIVALTGTASQLVLIDLKRELNIQGMDAIIRPDTFDRPELNFNLVSCPSDDKSKMLGQVMTAIARRLNVQDLATEANGIIFGYTPPQLWELFGEQVGEAKECVRTVLNGNAKQIRYGLYTGSPPKKSSFSVKEWNTYKERTLAAFKRGEISMLFGNAAVSVGIDNERLNYVINYLLPQSMEGYYQQCGRAGRSGQRSECYLIFSDDAPLTTQRWLNREIDQMPNRWDDLGTVAFFHGTNFPGQEEDVQGALKVFRFLFGLADENDMVEVPEFLDPGMIPAIAERTERYISYWLILGVLVDYEVTGMAANTVYRVKRHRVVEKFLRERNESSLKAHIVDHLHRFLSRYRPTLHSDVEKKLMARQEDNLSGKSIAFLVDFIYSQIEYQRREAIRTMVSYCNEKDTSPEQLRTRVRAYFDSSEKFSEGLLEMADGTVDFAVLAVLLDRVEAFDDAEHLYWETRRLLDERLRPDWAAANLFAIAYRERGAISDTFLRLFDDMVADLKGEKSSAFEFLGGFMTYLCRLDKIFGEPVSASLLVLCIGRLYENHRLAFIGLIDQIKVPADVKDLMRLQVVNIQVKEIIDAGYSRVTG